MAQLLIIAALAGLASAVLSAAMAGAGIGIFLTFIAPLPLIIVGLGWHPLVAGIGGLIAAIAFTQLFGWRSGAAFAFTTALPSYVLAHVVLTTRRDQVIGIVVMASCLLAGLAIFAAAASTMLDFASYEALLKRRITAILESPAMRQFGTQIPAPGTPQAQRFVDLFAQLMPVLSATTLALMLMINTWFAARIARRSDLMMQDWVPVWSMDLPRWSILVALLAFVVGMAPGYMGFAGELVSNGMTIALTLLGYAAVHDITRGMAGRGLMLLALWLGTFALAGIPALVMLLVGIAELAFGWRSRVRAGRNSTHPPQS
jgi:hypothetical protein